MSNYYYETLDSKLEYNYDDDGTLYLDTSQKFQSCNLNKKYVYLLVDWLYELLISFKHAYNLEYYTSLNTIIIDLTIGYIVKSKLTSFNNYQLILIISVYHCITTYHKNNIIKPLNIDNEELKKKLVYCTDNSCEWNDQISNTINEMIKYNFKLIN